MQAYRKQHYFESAVEPEISCSNISTIILRFSYDFVWYDTKQNKNVRQGTDCLVLITLEFDLEKKVLNKQTPITISYPGTSCNPPYRTGSAVANILLKFNHTKSEIADVTSTFSHQCQFSFKCKQSEVFTSCFFM